MANFCLLPSQAEKFMKALRDDKIDPSKLKDMTSEQRHKFFSDIVGERNAQGVNALFESKTLLKNQKLAYTSWAKKVAGLTPETRRDLISRIENLDRVLEPAEEAAFLKDLASTRLGFDVTEKEAKKIAEMSKRVVESRSAKEAGGDRMQEGYAKYDLTQYVSDLKNKASKLTLKEAIKTPGQSTVKMAGGIKSLKASLDNSAIFRQGWKTMFTNPKVWAKNASKTFSDFGKELKGIDAARDVSGDILSRPNYDLYRKAKLATATVEEAFPSSFPEKIPILGRAFKGSEAAYSGFLHRMRADVFDQYIEIAKKQGVDIGDKKELESIGKLVNSLTGRGHLGKFEGASEPLNNLLFSPRSVKANFDTLTAHQLQKDVTPFVRKKAAENLVKVIVGTGAVLGIAHAINPDAVDFDPRSTNFGKIKVGNTTFDVSGGNASILTLAARIASQSTKTSSGAVKKLGEGFGSKLGSDVLTDFMKNKLSPAAQIIKEVFVDQKTFEGGKPTVGGTAANALVPLPVMTAIELSKNRNGAPVLVGILADALGIATNTFSPGQKDWSTSTSKEMTQFKEKLGDGKFKEANEKYNQYYDDWRNGKKEFKGIQAYNQAPKDQQEALSETAREDLKKIIFKEYNFKYQKSDADKAAAREKAKATRERRKNMGL